MGYETQLKDSQGNDVYPITMGKLVYMNDGKTLQENISNNTEITQKMIDTSVDVCANKLLATVNERADKMLSNVPDSTVLNKCTSSGLASVPYVNNMFGVGEPTNIPIHFGANTIRSNCKTAMFPQIEFTGHHIVNLLGKDGNCEDASKWIDYQVTHTLDSTNKIFGSNGFKITLTANDGVICQLISAWNIDIAKYYLATAYVKNGNSTLGVRFHKNSTGGGVVIDTPPITDKTKFTRIALKLKPTDLGKDNVFGVGISGTAGQYAYCDGIMINEITADDYNYLSEAQLLAKYPYVDSYGALTNPYFENRKHNLIRNGNCEEGTGYWTDIYGGVTFSVVNGKFEYNSSGDFPCVGQMITIKPNTDYYVSSLGENGTAIGAYIQVCGMPNGQFVDPDGVVLKDGNGAFHVPDNVSKIIVVLRTAKVRGTVYFSKIMLTEGLTPPTEYRSCEIERFCLEGQFTDDDKVTIKDGQLSGYLYWKHKKMYGKDYEWKYNYDYAGFKRIYLEQFFTPNSAVELVNTMISPAGYSLKEMYTVDGNNQFLVQQPTGTLYLTIPDTDSGWVDNIQPNNDEVKAYMNGWKALDQTGGRYKYWAKIGATNLATDITAFPTGTATTLTLATTGTTSITVADTSMFKVGDCINIVYNAITTITAISGNTITLATAISTVSVVGTVVARLDNPTTDTRILNFCKNNVAPNYEGYRLHYKLKNPEPITNINAPVKGNIWALASGNNYVTVDSGMILDEVAKPIFNGANYVIGFSGEYYNSGYSPLQYKQFPTIDPFFADNAIVYKNEQYDPWSNGIYVNDGHKYCTPEKFNSLATYSIDYQICKTQHIQIFDSLLMTYKQDIFGAINTMTNIIEDKQLRNNVLDDLIDLSVYEELDAYSSGYQSIHLPWVRNNNIFYVSFDIPFKVQKTCTPTLGYSSLAIFCNGVACTSKFKPWCMIADKNRAVFKFNYDANAADVSNFTTYGLYGQIKVIADCRGRI